MSRRWKTRPAGSTWGDWGEDDVLGRLNLIDRASRRAGLREATEGEAFVLSLPLDVPGGTVVNPNRRPPVVRPNLRSGHVNFMCQMRDIDAGITDVMNDDLVVLHTQYSTQWDSLAHVGMNFDADGDGVPEPVFYNGYRGGVDLVGPADLTDAGADSLPGPSTSDAGPLAVSALASTGMQTRGVLVDLAHHLGEERRPVGLDDLREIMAADGVETGPGDVLLLHTGFAERLLAMDRNPDVTELDRLGAGLDGRDQQLLQWVTDSGLAAIAADNYAVEVFPARPTGAPSSFLPLHEHCLVRLGLPLGELWRLTPLANRLRELGRSRFLLTAPPLYLPGAVASPVTPVATV